MSSKGLLVLLAALLSTATAQTLTVWDQWYRGAENEVVEQLNREFEESHQGLTIERTARPLDDLKTTLRLSLDSGEGPGVANVNQGAPDMGEMVKANLLVPLDDYAERYGWTETFSEGLLARNRWSAEGAFGEGQLYGVAPQAEIIGVYYNKDLFEQAGVSVPETFEAFQDTLATLKEAGITPIVYGGLDGWPGIHLYGAVQQLYLNRDYLDSLIFGRGGSWVSEGNLKAAQLLVDWAEAGYFTPGYEGIGYDDSWALFAQGQGAMLISGSWLTGEFPEDANIGFFALPPLASKKDSVPLIVGGTGIPLSVTSNAENDDLAAEYLDWMVSPRAAELWVQAGFLPAMSVQEGAIDEGSLLGEVLTVWNRVNEADAIGHYLDWATPSMYDTLTAAVQELMAQRLTPEAFLERLDNNYQDYLAGQ